MDLKKLKEQFPEIKVKSEKWYFDTKTNKYISAKNIAKYLANKIVFELDTNKSKFKQIDSFKQKKN